MRNLTAQFAQFGVPLPPTASKDLLDILEGCSWNIEYLGQALEYGGLIVRAGSVPRIGEPVKGDRLYRDWRAIKMAAHGGESLAHTRRKFALCAWVRSVAGYRLRIRHEHEGPYGRADVWVPSMRIGGECGACPPTRAMELLYGNLNGLAVLPYWEENPEEYPMFLLSVNETGLQYGAALRDVRSADMIVRLNQMHQSLVSRANAARAARERHPEPAAGGAA